MNRFAPRVGAAVLAAAATVLELACIALIAEPGATSGRAVVVLPRVLITPAAFPDASAGPPRPRAAAVTPPAQLPRT
jgi:hypothetical protein